MSRVSLGGCIVYPKQAGTVYGSIPYTGIFRRVNLFDWLHALFGTQQKEVHSWRLYKRQPVSNRDMTPPVTEVFKK